MPGTILIAEDDRIIVKMLEAILRSDGYEVIVVPNGQEGLEKLKSMRPQLIITDVIMPVMDGASFYRAIKKSPETSNIPVLILTARHLMEESFKVMGVDEFIAKPYDEKELREKINFLCSASYQVKGPAEELKQRASETPGQGAAQESRGGLLSIFDNLSKDENFKFGLMIFSMFIAFVLVVILLMKITGR